MARRARQKKRFSTYYIEQTCQTDDMFKALNEVEAFIKSLSCTQCQYGFTVIGIDFSRNGYRLLLYDNGCDISSIMRSINIGYAMYNKRKNFKLTQRFQSKIIETGEVMLALIKDFKIDLPFDINQNVFNALRAYNSTREHGRIANLFSEYSQYKALGDYAVCLLKCTSEACIRQVKAQSHCLKSLDEAKTHLNNTLAMRGLSTEQMLADKKIRNDMILSYRQISTLTLKEIGILFGGMSESAISKMISRKYTKN